MENSRYFVSGLPCQQGLEGIELSKDFPSPFLVKVDRQVDGRTKQDQAENNQDPV